MRLGLLLLAALVSPISVSAVTVNCTNNASRDPKAVQKAVDSGGKVTVTGNCNFTITTGIDVKLSVALTGNATFTMNGHSGLGEVQGAGSNAAFNVNADDVTISNLTFTRGTAVHLYGATRQHFTFTGNKINNTNANNAVIVDGVLRYSLIDSNTFYYIARDSFLSETYAGLGFPGAWSVHGDTENGSAITGWGGLDHTNITNNSLDVIGGDGFHLGWNSISGISAYFVTTNVSISYNQFSRVHRMGIEIQDVFSGGNTCGPAGNETCQYGNIHGNGMKIAGNHFHDPFLPYTNTYGYSLAINHTNDLYINNSAIENIPSSGAAGLGYGIEAMGFGVLVQGNVVVADYLTGGGSHGWGTNIIFGGSRKEDVFTAQNNVLCGDQELTVGLGSEGAQNFSLGKISARYNYRANTCQNARHLTMNSISLAFVGSSVAGTNQTFKFSVVSVLPIKFVQFFLNGGAAPVATQEVQDVNTNFASDQKWLYSFTINRTSLTGNGSNTINAVATDVSGTTATASHSFTLAPEKALLPSTRKNRASPRLVLFHQPSRLSDNPS
jgi:hypothetical protein